MKRSVNQRAAAVIRDAEKDGQMMVLLNVLEAYQDSVRSLDRRDTLKYLELGQEIQSFFDSYLKSPRSLTPALLKNFLIEILPRIDSATVDHHEFDWPRDLIVEAIR